MSEFIQALDDLQRTGVLPQVKPVTEPELKGIQQLIEAIALGDTHKVHETSAELFAQFPSSLAAGSYLTLSMDDETARNALSDATVSRYVKGAAAAMVSCNPELVQSLRPEELRVIVRNDRSLGPRPEQRDRLIERLAGLGMREELGRMIREEVKRYQHHPMCAGPLHYYDVKTGESTERWWCAKNIGKLQALAISAGQTTDTPHGAITRNLKRCALDCGVVIWRTLPTVSEICIDRAFRDAGVKPGTEIAVNACTDRPNKLDVLPPLQSKPVPP